MLESDDDFDFDDEEGAKSKYFVTKTKSSTKTTEKKKDLPNKSTFDAFLSTKDDDIVDDSIFFPTLDAPSNASSTSKSHPMSSIQKMPAVTNDSSFESTNQTPPKSNDQSSHFKPLQSQGLFDLSPFKIPSPPPTKKTPEPETCISPSDNRLKRRRIPGPAGELPRISSSQMFQAKLSRKAEPKKSAKVIKKIPLRNTFTETGLPIQCTNFFTDS